MTPSVTSALIGSAILLLTTIILFVKEQKASKTARELSHNAKLKDDFINMVIHELRAPLTAIKDSSTLIIGSPDLEKDEKEKLLHVIHDQAQKMLDQISMLLDAAKLDAGRFTLEKVPSDLQKVLEEKIQIFAPQAERKQIKLIAQLGETLPLISFDPLRIGQVVNNLLSNSLKFTPEDGTITISLHHNTLRTVEVSVADTGTGIPKEKQATLFSKFYQVPENEKRAAGTGLGLYIVKSIVEAHGGTVFLTSEPDKGTTISFTLPI